MTSDNVERYAPSWACIDKDLGFSYEMLDWGPYWVGLERDVEAKRLEISVGLREPLETDGRVVVVGSLILTEDEVRGLGQCLHAPRN